MYYVSISSIEVSYESYKPLHGDLCTKVKKVFIKLWLPSFRYLVQYLYVASHECGAASSLLLILVLVQLKATYFAQTQYF